MALKMDRLAYIYRDLPVLDPVGIGVLIRVDNFEGLH